MKIQLEVQISVLHIFQSHPVRPDWNLCEADSGPPALIV